METELKNESLFKEKLKRGGIKTKFNTAFKGKAAQIFLKVLQTIKDEGLLPDLFPKARIA